MGLIMDFLEAIWKTAAGYHVYKKKDEEEVEIKEPEEYVNPDLEKELELISENPELSSTVVSYGDPGRRIEAWHEEEDDDNVESMDSTEKIDEYGKKQLEEYIQYKTDEENNEEDDNDEDESDGDSEDADSGDNNSDDL